MSTCLELLSLFLFCIALFPYKTVSAAFIAGVLLILAFCCFELIVQKKKALIFWGILAFLLCFVLPELSFFLPVLCYMFFYRKLYWVPCLYILPAIFYLHENHNYVNLMIVPLTALSFYLAYQNRNRQELQTGIHSLRDNSVEQEINLKQQNIQLLEEQNNQIYIATLKERNRIAREIHDNVGHMLSRSILQIGALLAINKDETMIQPLDALKSTLNEAMDNVRNSVHDLHDQSIDLENALSNLIGSFTFCPVQFHCDITKEVPTEVKYCFIAITKEALNNIIRHSNATKVTITIKEHPGFYQLLIHDNGSQMKGFSAKNSENNGIGLTNMKERVLMIHGIIHISTENGFRIFVSVPK